MSEQLPAIVLVHGAWADASSWNAVIRRLQNDGYTVYAPPNPLRGLPQDSAYLHDFLTQNPALAGKPVVLVGHSYGGAVITNAAVGDPKVKALVYVDAFIPDQGETIGGGLRARARILPAGGNPADIFNLGALPRRPARGRGHLHQAEPGPRLLRQRPARSQAAVIAATQRPLAGQHAVRALRGPGLEDHPVVGRDRHRGQGHPARFADLHGQAGQGPHHQGERRAPVHDRRPATVAQVIEQAAKATS